MCLPLFIRESTLIDSVSIRATCMRSNVLVRPRIDLTQNDIFETFNLRWTQASSHRAQELGNFWYVSFCGSANQYAKRYLGTIQFLVLLLLKLAWYFVRTKAKLAREQARLRHNHEPGF
jgi:hypothetical protein